MNSYEYNLYCVRFAYFISSISWVGATYTVDIGLTKNFELIILRLACLPQNTKENELLLIFLLNFFLDCTLTHIF